LEGSAGPAWRCVRDLDEEDAHEVQKKRKRIPARIKILYLYEDIFLNYVIDYG
jgi:hypothetical protein